MHDIKEKREWARFILPVASTRLSWTAGGMIEVHLGSLVDRSSRGVAMMLDIAPPTDQAFMVHLDDGRAGSRPIPSHLISAERMPSGRTLAKFDFDSIQEEPPCSRHESERRSWQRVVPKEKRAVLSWRAGEQAVSVPGLLRNIGGGGAAIQTGAAPPIGAMIWLRVGGDGHEAPPVECRVLGCQSSPTGSQLVRVSFAGMCPMSLYRVAMGMDL